MQFLEEIRDMFDIVVYPDAVLKQVKGYGTTALLLGDFLSAFIT
jgi:hypothetical protein